jgi:ribosome modulation factor
MPSFKEKIESNREKHAYVLGAKAAMDGYSIDMRPFRHDAFVDQEWLDGYLDVVFLGAL